MSHLVETMAYKNEVPWHGLGNRLTQNEPLEVWLVEAGMDWQINESPVMFKAANTDKSFPENKVLYRSDTLAPLAVVSNRYKVVQPREVLEFYRDLVATGGFELETAGVLKEGKKLWALAKTGQEAVLKGGDRVKAYQCTTYGKDYPFVSEEDFIAAHGPKPWNLLNDILQTFDSLEYRINSPEGSDCFLTYQLKLVHIRNSTLMIDFSSLSSGEKILMALVASIYKASTDNVFPDVLLLDEIDASLHPSMMKNMLEVIRNIFLAHSVRVILVTHSPTTIALAPEDSVYVMNKPGLKRIEKKTKQEALSILTEGFATLDEGIRLFDQVSINKISVISEGNNANLIKKAFELYNCSGVDVVSGFEGVSGKSQLKTLFEFFSRATHNGKVIFVWDCDVTYSLSKRNNTFPYTFAKNANNSIATSGIENMFPEALFANFKKTITLSTKVTKVEFDGDRKDDFSNFVLDRNNKDDFLTFKPFVDYVISIRDA